MGGGLGGFFSNPIDSLIGFGLDLIGQNQERKSQEGIAHGQEQLTREQMAMQKEFAQHGLSWKVQDAIDAGLSPLAALGPQGTSYSPVYSTPTQMPDKSLPYHNLGQNLSRAAMAGSENEIRIQRAAESAALVDKYGADADLARQQAAESAYRMGLPKNPPLPSHVRVRNQDGSYSMINNPDIAASIMSDPLGAWGTSVANSVRNAAASPKWDIVLPAKNIKGWRTLEAEREHRGYKH